MPVRTPLTLAAVLGGLILLPATHASATTCDAETTQNFLLASDALTQDDIDGGVVVNLVRCGDVTGDGASDVVYTLSSGGTAGDTQFGVIKGNADGTLSGRILNKKGYKVGIARHNSKSFDVMQPFYKSTDPNCCPSSFRQTRYTWNGTRFKAGKAKKLKKAPARFYRP
ncbi:hypothetical protein [Solirubrobacter soli]|uniref:hypothetical protein n=1 Tax=Solirubrobacter soli TaxID=363832 RepID=UPI00041879F2|nr:hypothetical protein [Solirubrobacter soli]